MSAIISIIFSVEIESIVRFIDRVDGFIMTLSYREFITWVENAEDMNRTFLRLLVNNLDEQEQHVIVDSIFVILRNN